MCDEIVEEGARVLCEYTELCRFSARWLAPKVALMGGLFHRDSIYTHAFRRRLKKNLPDARVTVAERPPNSAPHGLRAEKGDHVAFQSKLSEKEIEDWLPRLPNNDNPRSENLEKMSARQLAELFVQEEKICGGCVAWSNWDLARAIEMVTNRSESWPAVLCRGWQ